MIRKFIIKFSNDNELIKFKFIGVIIIMIIGEVLLWKMIIQII